jgi:hypothetical protein
MDEARGIRCCFPDTTDDRMTGLSLQDGGKSSPRPGPAIGWLGVKLHVHVPWTGRENGKSGRPSGGRTDPEMGKRLSFVPSRGGISHRLSAGRDFSWSWHPLVHLEQPELIFLLETTSAASS